MKGGGHPGRRAQQEQGRLRSEEEQGAGGRELGRVHAPQQRAPQEGRSGAARAACTGSHPGACGSHRGPHLGFKRHEEVQAPGQEEAVNARQRKGLGCGGGGASRNHRHSSAAWPGCRHRAVRARGRTQVASDGMKDPRDLALGCKGT